MVRHTYDLSTWKVDASEFKSNSLKMHPVSLAVCERVFLVKYDWRHSEVTWDWKGKKVKVYESKQDRL